MLPVRRKVQPSGDEPRRTRAEASRHRQPSGSEKKAPRPAGPKRPSSDKEELLLLEEREPGASLHQIFSLTPLVGGTPANRVHLCQVMHFRGTQDPCLLHPRLQFG